MLVFPEESTDTEDSDQDSDDDDDGDSDKGESGLFHSLLQFFHI